MNISRSLLHKLLTNTTNGDKVVVSKLDSCVSATGEDVDDDEYGIIVDHKYLVDKDPRSMVVIKDLLHLPHEISTKVLSHPVITTFIEKRWLRTRWTFLISFTLYLIFVLFFSSFLWLMYETYEKNDKNDTIRIPVNLPARCDPLQLIQGADEGTKKERNTSLASKGALAHGLQRRTACKILIGHQGAPKWPTGSGKVSTPRFLGILSNFR